MPRTKSAKKTKYTSVQISKDLIDLIQDIIPGIYRSQSEFIHFWINYGITEVVKVKHKMKKLKIDL
ncbi:MAG: hypothetical protein ACFFBI_00345 [Promethearchaeota archaeon]